MIIACDIDGCLANFNEGYRSLFSGQDFPPPSVDFPPVWHWPQHYGASAKEVNTAWRVILQSATFWENLSPLPSAKEAIFHLNNARMDGHEIYFLTTRGGVDCKGQTWRWLKQHGFNDPTVLISASTPQAKGYVCSGLGIDVMIDDRPLNLNNVFAPTRRYLVHAPYNTEEQSPLVGGTRINTVLDALALEGLA